ncbi:MAG: GTP-binding protein [Cyanophyceae cyanobacterium]
MTSKPVAQRLNFKIQIPKFSAVTADSAADSASDFVAEESLQPSDNHSENSQGEWDELDELWDLSTVPLRDVPAQDEDWKGKQVQKSAKQQAEADGLLANPIIAELAELQTEVAYKRTEYTLRDWLDNLDLTPRERRGLEQDIAGVGVVLKKLERATVQIATFGMVGRGKSSVLNALLGKPVFTTGALHGVTQTCDSVVWELEEAIAAGSAGGIERVELVDTPGLDEVNGADREAIAQKISHQADLLLFVISGDMTQLECEALSRLRQAGKPMVLVFNKVDRFPHADRQAVYETLRDKRVRSLISPDEIVMTSAAPLVAQQTHREDGTVGVIWQPGEANVGELREKIFEILRREGKALVALNSLLYTNATQEQVLERKLTRRDAAANRIIWRATLAKGLAVALNPVTIFDLVGSAAVDATAILTLSRLYNIPMGNKGAFDLLQKIAIALGTISAGEVAANLGLSSLKGILGISTVATGGATLLPYLSVAVTQGAIAGVSSYAIGQVAKEYFANEGSWGENGPRALVQTILANLDEAALTKRIEGELRQRLLGHRRANSG